MNKAFSLFITAGLLVVSLPAWADDKKTLKEAVQGAITGAVAAEASQDPNTPVPANKPKAGKIAEKHEKDKKPWWLGGGEKHEDKRPHGWDQGEKKGWGESDVPPGFDKGEKKGWDEGGMPPGLAGGGEGGGKGKGGGKKK